MKSGASDPFADDSPPGGTASDDDAGNDSEPTEDADGERAAASDSEDDANNTSGLNRSDLPYTLRRDKVKDERDSVHQLFVQDDTDTAERDARRDLEDRFDEDVYKLDAREAIYLAGMRNVDDAEEILREWGYDL